MKKHIPESLILDFETTLTWFSSVHSKVPVRQGHKDLVVKVQNALHGGGMADLCSALTRSDVVRTLVDMNTETKRDMTKY